MKILCKKCETGKIVKSWFTRWLQRYLCKTCWCNFTNTPKRWAPEEVKKKALKLYLEWLWFRAIWRVLWYSNVAILKWIKAMWKKIEKYHEETKKYVKIESWELDELRHYVKKNKTKCDYELYVKDGKLRLLTLN